MFLKLTDEQRSGTPYYPCLSTSKLTALGSKASLASLFFHYGILYSFPVIRDLLGVPAAVFWNFWILLFVGSFITQPVDPPFSIYLLSLRWNVCWDSECATYLLILCLLPMVPDLNSRSIMSFWVMITSCLTWSLGFMVRKKFYEDPTDVIDLFWSILIAFACEIVGLISTIVELMLRLR